MQKKLATSVEARRIQIQDIPESLALLTDLKAAWRALPIGTKAEINCSVLEARETLSRLQLLLTPGDLNQTKTVIKRLLAHYPRKDVVADSVAEDWVRKLMPYPIASVWQCYDLEIEKPREFGPGLGVFLHLVKAHASGTQAAIEKYTAMLKAAEKSRGGKPNPQTPKEITNAI